MGLVPVGRHIEVSSESSELVSHLVELWLELLMDISNRSMQVMLHVHHVSLELFEERSMYVFLEK